MRPTERASLPKSNSLLSRLYFSCREYCAPNRGPTQPCTIRRILRGATAKNVGVWNADAWSGRAEFAEITSADARRASSAVAAAGVRYVMSELSKSFPSLITQGSCSSTAWVECSTIRRSILQIFLATWKGIQKGREIDQIRSIRGFVRLKSTNPPKPTLSESNPRRILTPVSWRLQLYRCGYFPASKDQRADRIAG